MTPMPVVDPVRLGRTCLRMTSIPSPTGHEGALAEWIAGHLEGSGLRVELQPFDGSRANVVARWPGSGDGPTIALYSAIDTAFPTEEDEASGALGEPVPLPLRNGAHETGGWIVGPGAENPKGYAAAAIEAVTAIAESGLHTPGDVLLVLTAGGMPSLGSAGGGGRGLGAGCRVFLERSPHPDAVVIAKPGDAVSWAEVGIAIFRIHVRGDLGYTGIRHRRPSRDAVRDGARIATALDGWFDSYSRARTTDLLAPQGAVTGIHGGWLDRPAFTPADCDLIVDLRTVPDEPLESVTAALESAVRVVEGIECDVTLEYLGGYPGAVTDPGSWIVRSAIRAWEARRGRSHQPTRGSSGVTDASILRAAGIPTARVGPPPSSTQPVHAGFTMGVIEVEALADLARILVDIVTEHRGRDLGAATRAQQPGASR
jgi:acetylornithine deacetylase/succinyl-diaminopimelate desuccinylase-like protein